MEPEEQPEEQKVTRGRPTHAPMWITILAIVIATGFACILVYVLMNETTGPGEVLHGFYEAMDDGDCEDALAFTSGIDESTLCASTTSTEGALAADPTIDSITLEGEGGNEASVVVQESPGSSETVTWTLELVDGEWLITGCPDTGALASAC